MNPGRFQDLVRGGLISVTERKQADAALHKTEARCREWADDYPYGVYWVTLEGKLLCANEALAQMLGYNSAKERLAVEGTEAFDRDPSAREKIVAEFLRTERADATAGWKRKDGRTIPVRNMARNAEEPQRGDECIEVAAEHITL